MLHALSEQIAGLVGAPADNVLGLLAILLSYVEAIVFNVLPNSEQIKSLFSIAATSFLMVQLFDLEGALHLLSAIVYTWLISKAMPGRNGAILIFSSVMLHLAYNHLHRQVFAGIDDYKSFDHTAPFMVLAIKLTAYGFSVWDGHRPESEITDYQRRKAIRDVPNLISFAGYCLFFGGFLAGPAFEYADYHLFCTGTLSPKPIRGVILPTLRCVVYGVGTLLVFLFLGEYSYQFTQSATFLSFPLPLRFLAFSLCGIQARAKYYTAWKLAEGACVLTGLGWNGEVEEDDGKGGKRLRTRWDRVSNVHPTQIEFSPGWNNLVKNWNINTQSWLENHIYRRFLKNGRPTGYGMLATYGVSAFWHGFYPGYYLFFFVSALTTSLANSVRRSIRPFFLAPSPLAPYKPLYDVLTWFTSLTFLNYFASSFQLLDFQVAIKTWATVNFVPHAIVVGGIVIFKMGLERYFQNVQRHWGLLKDKPKTRVGEGKVEEKKEDKEAAKEAKVEKEAAEDVEHKENGKTSPATPSRRSLRQRAVRAD